MDKTKLTLEEAKAIKEEHNLFTLEDEDLDWATRDSGCNEDIMIGWHRDYLHEQRCDGIAQREHEQNYL